MSINILKQEKYEINKSKFISIYLNVNSVLEFNIYLDKLKLEHKKAAHFCYAYKIIGEQHYVKAYDDKEPKGSAGYPIYKLIETKQLNNVAIIVIRYYGEQKLGKGLLTRSYLKAALLLFEQ